jgi:hypothetical protein
MRSKRSPSRGTILPELLPDHCPSKSKRAQGMPGEGLTRGPGASKKHGEGTTGSAESSGIPCAMVLTVSFAFSLGTGLCCPHRRADRIRATWSQRRETRTTRLRRPRRPRSSGEANTSIASRPAFVTTRPPLFIETRWRNHTSDLQNQSNELFLRKGLDKTRRASRDLPDGRSEADR